MEALIPSIFHVFFIIGVSNNVTDNQTIFGKHRYTGSHIGNFVENWFFFQVNQKETFALPEMSIDVYI